MYILRLWKKGVLEVEVEVEKEYLDENLSEKLLHNLYSSNKFFEYYWLSTGIRLSIWKVSLRRKYSVAQCMLIPDTKYLMVRNISYYSLKDEIRQEKNKSKSYTYIRE